MCLFLTWKHDADRTASGSGTNPGNSSYGVRSERHLRGAEQA